MRQHQNRLDNSLYIWKYKMPEWSVGTYVFHFEKNLIPLIKVGFKSAVFVPPKKIIIKNDPSLAYNTNKRS